MEGLAATHPERQSLSPPSQGLVGLLLHVLFRPEIMLLKAVCYQTGIEEVILELRMGLVTPQRLDLDGKSEWIRNILCSNG